MWSLNIYVNQTINNDMVSQCRLKVGDTFYGEFMQSASDQKQMDEGAVDGSPSSKRLLTTDKASELVTKAVRNVLGLSLGADRPLVEAGLDSLGAALFIFLADETNFSSLPASLETI